MEYIESCNSCDIDMFDIKLDNNAQKILDRVIDCVINVVSSDDTPPKIPKIENMGKKTFNMMKKLTMYKPTILQGLGPKIEGFNFAKALTQEITNKTLKNIFKVIESNDRNEFEKIRFRNIQKAYIVKMYDTELEKARKHDKNIMIPANRLISQFKKLSDVDKTRVQQYKDAIEILHMEIKIIDVICYFEFHSKEYLQKNARYYTNYIL